ncbi:MAG: protein-L-isoaspartate(D-aspartate) O-methyltransferase [Candidatus Omnitrophica bacterium]|nr:protein-L-isoaspartate(D-aspartate) O-methyltransferase [Candidatus Omnitrophota bacterium]
MTYQEQRERMVEEQIRQRGISDERLLAALRRVPRHLFVPDEVRHQAYADHPLAIGEGQTISQPYMVALTLNSLKLQGHERILEVGSGSGYQTAILAELALEVHAVERLVALLKGAQECLEKLGYWNVHWSVTDGSLGLPELAPFDGIVVSAAVPEVPQPLISQLVTGGRIVLPIGSRETQMLTEIRKVDGSLARQEIASCVFVPLIGRFGWPA